MRTKETGNKTQENKQRVNEMEMKPKTKACVCQLSNVESGTRAEFTSSNNNKNVT